LNAIKEIKVTDSYLRLDKDVRGCQYNEPLFNCTTRKNVETVQNACGCLPFNINLSNKVNLIKIKKIRLFGLENLTIIINCTI